MGLARQAHLETTFLMQIDLVLILLGQVLGGVRAAHRPAQSVIGWRLAGLVLGPSFLGAFLAVPGLVRAESRADAVVDSVSQVGILLLLLLTASTST